MLLLMVFVLFLIVFQDKNRVVSSVELVESYSINQKTADNKFLNKNIELSGSVISFIQLESGTNYLEMKSNDEYLKLLCILNELIIVQKHLH